MSKKMLLALLAVVALVATPAFASVQNVKISGELDSTFVHRDNFDLIPGDGGVLQNNDQQSVFISQATVQIDADLTDKVSATVAVINERAWGDGSVTTTGTDIDLWKAYVTLRELLYSPLTVIIGRQSFAYGNSFVFDSAGTNTSAPTDSGLNNVAEDLTKQTNMDAVRAILDYNPLKIEGFVAVSNQGVVLINDVEDEAMIYGLVGTYSFNDKRNSLVEAYIFDKKDQTSNDTDAELGNHVNRIKVVGGRLSTNVIDSLNVQAEFAHQGGTIAGSPGVGFNKTRNALAFQGIVNYQVPVLKDHAPMLQYVFTKVTGDSADSTDTDYTAWDPFYENQAGGTIYNTLYNLSNAEIHTVSLSGKVMEDVSSKLSLTKLFTQQKFGADQSLTLLQPDGASSTPATNGSSDLGIEVDWTATYDYTEDVQFGLNVGVYKPGEIFEKKENAKQVLANVNVKF